MPANKIIIIFQQNDILAFTISCMSFAFTGRFKVLRVTQYIADIACLITRPSRGQ